MLNIETNPELRRVLYELSDASLSVPVSTAALHARLVPDHGQREKGFAGDEPYLNTTFRDDERSGGGRGGDKWKGGSESPLSDSAAFDKEAGGHSAFQEGQKTGAAATFRFANVEGFFRYLQRTKSSNEEFKFPGFSLAEFDKPGAGNGCQIVEDVADGFATLVVRNSLRLSDLGPEAKAVAVEVIKLRILGRPDPVPPPRRA